MVCLLAVITGCGKVEKNEYELPYNGWDPEVSTSDLTRIDTCYFNSDDRVYCEFSLTSAVPDPSLVTGFWMYVNNNRRDFIPNDGTNSYLGSYKLTFNAPKTYRVAIITKNGESRGGNTFKLEL